MRKRHRWIDKRRHRKALGIQSPREMIAMLHRQTTNLPGYRKDWERHQRRQEQLMLNLIEYYDSIRAQRVTP
jgi:hypothetical protein